MRIEVAIILAAAACGGGRKPAPAQKDAGVTVDAAVAVDAAIAVDARGAPALQGLPADAKVPGGARIGSRIVGGGRFVDAAGDNYVYFVERATRDRSSVSLYAMHELGVGPDARRLRELDDRAESCPTPSATAFVDGSLEITDLDGDGIGEVWLAWIVGCGTDEEPLSAKQYVLEGKDTYVIGGDEPFGGHANPDAASWPPGWLDRARERFESVARTLAPSPGAALVMSEEEFTDIVVEKPGDLPMHVSYPDLAALPDALAADLTKRMRAFLRADENWGADMEGRHEGDCKVGLITPEVISIQCRRMIDARTHAQARQGIIEAPGDHTRAAFTYWREAKLPAIDPVELVGADRLKSLCGDAPRPMFILDRDGLRWVVDEDRVAPDDCIGGIEWADMAPTSARARLTASRTDQTTPR